MSFVWTRAVQGAGTMALMLACAAVAACGSGSGGDTFTAGEDGGPPSAEAGKESGSLTGPDGGLLGNAPNLLSITVDPPTASIESLNGAAVTQAFTVTGHYDNGSTMKLANGIGWTAGEAEGWVRDFVTYLASVSHLDSFSKGTVDLKDIVYFLSIIVLGLFATNRAVEAHRWS